MADDDRENGSPLTPTPASRRIASIDVLRGFALLGILVMNIPSFAYIGASWMNPRLGGWNSSLDQSAWLVSHLFFDLKMMAIFSMLFGAGIALMRDRLTAPIATHYKRMAWLLIIGLAHAYLVWEGDILVAYAICGMIVFWLAPLRPRWLISIGLALMSVALLFNFAYGSLLEGARDAWQAAHQLPEESRPAYDWRVQLWEEASAEYRPDAETIAEEAASFTGGYFDRLPVRAIISLWMQTFLFAVWMFWRVAGLMLLGMGLYKLGLLSARLTVRTYTTLCVIGYAVGLPLILHGAQQMQAHDFDPVYLFKTGWAFNYTASILVALAHVSLVMIVCKTSILTTLRNALAAVGRMALTNYLAQSMICAILFYGYGFNLWGELSRAELLAVVAAIWALQLIWSPLWLARYKFGPMEWLWRSLTYWKRQPMRINSGD